MKYLILIVLLFTSLFIAAFTFIDTDEPQNQEIAVVELFTSQGCSSCPAADKLLSKMSDRGDVIALSFHVAYWNYLGWKDPYSSEDYTKRQRSYGAKLGLNTIYTPQMIVNGKHEFVGSNSNKLERSLATSKKLQPIRITEIRKEGSKLRLTYELEEKTAAILNVALVERHLENYVPRGENSGRTLKHDNVVRDFITTEAQVSAEIVLENLPTFSSLETAVVLYLQDRTTWEVIGAAKASL